MRSVSTVADMLGIQWDDEIGIIDMSTRRMILIANLEEDGVVSFFGPMVTLQDTDFRLLGEKAASRLSWGNVADLLVHPDFQLQSRIVIRQDL